MRDRWFCHLDSDKDGIHFMNSTEHADQEMQMVSTRREGGQQVDEVSEEPSDGSSETMRAKRTDEVGVDAHFMNGAAATPLAWFA